METLVIVCFTLLFGLLGLLAFLLLRIRNSPEELSESNEVTTESNQSNRPINENELRIGTKIIKSRNSKVSSKKTKNNDNEEDDPNEPTTSGTSSTFGVEVSSTGKIGKKKLQKLEMKAEKKAAREQEIQMREEKKLQKEKEDEIQRQIDEERETKEREKEEEAKRLIEEQKQKEYEEYLKIKKSFIVEEEGFDSQDNEQQNKLIDFINYIKDKKIVMLEELAGQFKMKTQEVINRIQELLDTEQIEGVIDDRGKFIYITQDELNSVAKFIKQNGRVSIIDLVENSNRLIQLQQIAKK